MYPADYLPVLRIAVDHGLADPQNSTSEVFPSYALPGPILKTDVSRAQMLNCSCFASSLRGNNVVGLARVAIPNHGTYNPLLCYLMSLIEYFITENTIN